ncbi:DUF4159 domain-containing protein [Candidatus Palauibacter sp.]|uniref:DUF4159 domain-containing protein n=1 Tax=Candidatus Palauibacter sp. TaxID=3101350 RepID=UPI003B025190
MTARTRLVARRLATGGLAALLTLLAAADLEGQRGRGRRGGGFGDDLGAYQEYNTPYTGEFTFVRLYYRTGGRGWNPGWSHDWPVAERNFGEIMDALTTIGPRRGGGNVLAMDDPDLFKFPVAYLSEPGDWGMNEAEADNLSNYLRKGGFLIIDDMGGQRDLDWTEQVLGVLLPGLELVELDVSHPIFDSFFHLEQSNIEMPHPYRGGMASYWGVFEDNDPDGRLMVIVNHDNDIGDYMEWSDRGFVPIALSNEAYKLGVNYVVYALTH